MGQDPEHIQNIRRLRQEVYGEYGFSYYVPLAESYTVQVPVTVSCSYRRCLFCDLNQGMPFRELSLDEIDAASTPFPAGGGKPLRPVHGEVVDHCGAGAYCLPGV